MRIRALGPVDDRQECLCGHCAPGLPSRNAGFSRVCPLFSLHPGASRCRYLTSCGYLGVFLGAMSGGYGTLSLLCQQQQRIPRSGQGGVFAFPGRVAIPLNRHHRHRNH